MQVPFEFVFPSWPMFLGVEADIDFDAKQAGVADWQARDKETGDRLWVVTVMDQDPEAAKFGRSPTVKVKVAAPQQPVPPAPQAEGFNPLVAFEGLMISPWPDRSLCKAPQPGREHKCRARQAYTMWATAMVDPADLARAGS
jgi:hypothetical protein